MASNARTSTALILALTIGALASVVDGCVVFCVTQRPASASVPPACHHARSAAVQIGRAVTPCTHVHTGFVATVRADWSRFTHAADAIAANALVSAILDSMPRQFVPATWPPLLTISLDRPLALRI